MAPPVKLTIVNRGPLRISSVQDEEWVEGNSITQSFVRALKASKRGSDIFTFSAPLPERNLVHAFHAEWDNVAVARIDQGFNAWWEALPQETRKNVRRSQRRGVSTSPVSFDDAFVLGISRIYNETPVRQGRRFRHFNKPLEQVRAENATYLDRSQFVGAFFNAELIGFIKMVRVNSVMRIMQIVSLDAHSDKRPTNALLAKAIELCCERDVTHLVYGKYVYGNKNGSPVTEFKRRNGFERLDFPRYYVPLTLTGSIALRLGLHRELGRFIPEKATNFLLNLRASIYRRRFRLRETSSPKSFAGVAQR